MCNLINTHTHMTRMTGPDCVVMCNLINTHTHTHTHRGGSEGSSGDGNGDEDNGNGNEDRIGEGGKEAKKRKKPQNSCRRPAETGETWVERGNNVEKKGLVQQLPTQIICTE